MALAAHPSPTRRQSVLGSPSRPGRTTPHALIVHHADVVRAGVSTLLASGSVCEVSNAASVYEAFRLAAVQHPQMILFDYTNAEGAEASRLFGGLWPRPKLVALVSKGATITARQCLDGGTDAAIAIDNVSRETFLSVVQHAFDGDGQVAAGFAVDSGPSPVATVSDGPVALLTRREREMLFLIGEGLSNKEIADSLVLSIKTVEAHRANLARKLNIRSRSGLMRLALAGGLA
jgi:two-component system secretion response regulator SsrB